MSADPAEFRILSRRVRAPERCAGTGEKTLQPCEGPLTVAARRSIAAARDVPAGARLEADDLMWVRPGTGLPPGEESRLVGRVTTRALLAGEIIDLTAVGP